MNRGMSVHSLAIKTNGVSARWRPRLMLLFIIACFLVPLAIAWLLVGHWRPDSSVQHGELLNPARPLTALRFTPLNDREPDGTTLRGHWVLIYAGSAGECAAACQTALYDLRQVRLALGKDMGRVKTLLLLDNEPIAELRQWLVDEHAAMIVGVADLAARTELAGAFSQPGSAGDWIYLLDPLGNLLMRYSVASEPRGMLEDLQRLLRLSKIG
jgi:hypothetical protein